MPLIVIEGLDGTGKATQTELLATAAKSCSAAPVHKLSFPCYDSPSSGPIQMYQRGEFGKDANAINPWIASTFYAVDRAASFLKDWKAYYDNGDLIISDRYVTSNVIYQMGKLPRNQWESYLEWEYDLEHDKYGLPVPDVVIFLDVPLSVSQKMMSARYGGDESKKDIHESNLLFLKQCRATGWFAARRLGWKIVSCWEDNHLLSIDQIHERITRTVGQCEQVRELFI